MKAQATRPAHATDKTAAAAMPAETRHRAKEHGGIIGVFKQFFHSFKLDKRFLKIWGIDVLFWLCVTIIAVIVAASYAEVMQSIDSLRADMGEAGAQAAWAAMGNYVFVLVMVYVAIFLAFVLFQTLLWRILVPHSAGAQGSQRLSARMLGRFLVFCVISLPIVSLFAIILVYLVGVFTTLAATVLGTIAVVVMPVIFAVFVILTLPLIVWPYYGFFKEGKVWRGLGRACWAGLSTVPQVWPHYLLGGIALAIICTAWAVFTIMDFWVGTFAGAALLAAPCLAWLRLYLVRMIETHEDW